jgi:hypothetical protein
MNRGVRCSCGHFTSKIPDDQKYPNEDEKEKKRAASEAEFQHKVDKWLLDRGIVSSEMSKPERMKSMAKYRDRIGREPKRPGRQWADDILSREGEGESLPLIACEFARKVVNQHSYSSDDPTEEIDLDGIPTDF